MDHYDKAEEYLIALTDRGDKAMVHAILAVADAIREDRAENVIDLSELFDTEE